MRMKGIFLFIILFLISCFNPTQERVEVDVSDFGILPNTGQNNVMQINKLIENIDSNTPIEIIFPKGRYDFSPDSNYYKKYYETNTYDVNPKRLAIFIYKKENITINGKGSDFIFHDHIQPFTLDNSENITIKNVNIDWEKPLTAEAEVVKANNSEILLRIDTTQFPYKVQDNGIQFQGVNWQANWSVSGGSWLIEYNEKHIIPPQTGDLGCINGDLKNVEYKNIKPGLLQLKGNFSKIPAVGNHLIMRHSTRDHAGMFIFHSKNIKLDNINVYHTSGLGILSQYSENIAMNRVNMIPNPDKDRYLSGHDDGFHFMGCKGQINIDSCRFEGLMDDPINIHGTYAPVIARIDDKTLKCKFEHGMSSGLIWGQPDDKVSFIKSSSMKRVGNDVLKKFERIDKDRFVLHFEHELPQKVQKGDALENITRVPDARIKNCFVGSCRARGFLLSTPGDVIVENNIFQTSGSAILIAGDANYWYESGAVENVQIRNNEFRAPCNSSPYQFCKAVITILPIVPQPDTSKPFHKNIAIYNNTFHLSDYPLLYAFSVENLRFENNIIRRSHLFEPWRENKYTFTLDACKNVSINANEIAETVLGKNAKIKRMPKEFYRIQEDIKINHKKLE